MFAVRAESHCPRLFNGNGGGGGVSRGGVVRGCSGVGMMVGEVEWRVGSGDG